MSFPFPAGHAELTAQEGQIACMAATGCRIAKSPSGCSSAQARSNPVYAKSSPNSGISRSQLDRVLPTGSGADRVDGA
jgi:hypothetical protein